MNWGGGDYGMSSHGGGGGFVPGQDSSQSGGTKKHSGDKSLVPITIKQILDSNQDGPDDLPKIDGRDTGQITLVGQIMEVQETSNYNNYMLDDGTGTIKVTFWLESDATELERQHLIALEVGKYVRVVGNIRSQSDKQPSAKWHLVAFHIRPIEDFNEITYHFLDACHAHLYNTRGQVSAPTAKYSAPVINQSRPLPNGGGGGGAGGGFGAGASHYAAPPPAAPAAHFNPNMGGSRPAAATAAPAAAGGQDLTAILGDAFVQQRAEGGETGWHIQRLCEHASHALGRAVQVEELRHALEQLAGDGHVYTTIDEDHYAST